MAYFLLLNVEGKRMKTIYKNKGFTLLELMIVIAIAGILAVIAIPNWFTWRATAKINGAATNLRGDLEFAKMRAIKENRRITVLFETVNRYRIFIDDYFASGNGSKWNYDVGIDTLLKIRELIPGVTASNTFINSGTRFNGRGILENDPDPNNGIITVVDSSNNQRRISVNRLGRIQLQYN